jgi:signal transduction histidine kinase
MDRGAGAANKRRSLFSGRSIGDFDRSAPCPHLERRRWRILSHESTRMALSIITLSVLIFGAYAYGSLVILSLRQRSPIWTSQAVPGALKTVPVQSLALFVVCTAWFVLHSVIEFRFLMGDARKDDLIDLAALVLVFAFPGLILHAVWSDHTEEPSHRTATRLRFAILFGLYAAGATLAAYFSAVLLGWITRPPLGPFIGLSIGALFTVTSVTSIAVMSARRRTAPTPDQQRLRGAMTGLFVALIAVVFMMSFMRQSPMLISILDGGLRMTPLAFLLVSVYFESRIEFYDLIVKRGVLLLITLGLVGGGLAISLRWLDALPEGPARAWMFAVVLLPLAMLLPWIHTHAGRLLDRIWFGRDFTPVEAIKHVLGAMQQATDESSLRTAAEATLSEMFRRHIVIVPEAHPVPEDATVVTEIRSPSGSSTVRIATIDTPGERAMLSEDLALLRSLGGVCGFMLENVRLQRRRQEQEQLAQELRLQSSRSELKALRAQINPHFLFNALNAIASLIHTDPARADSVVEQLAEVFRYTLRRSEHEWAPLDQELAFARAYLDVEQARFGRRLEFSIDLDPALRSVLVPSMMLQTLVENAVKHGISQLRTPGRIEVRASSDTGRIRIEVRDTGPGLEPTDRSPSITGASFGLRSVRDRLHGYFGSEGWLELVREHDATVARIHMPLVTDSSELAAVASR